MYLKTHFPSFNGQRTVRLDSVSIDVSHLQELSGYHIRILHSIIFFGKVTAILLEVTQHKSGISVET